MKIIAMALWVLLFLSMATMLIADYRRNYRLGRLAFITGLATGGIIALWLMYIE